MEADDISDVDIQTTAIDRDKIAESIAMFQDTMTIEPPDINTSGFGFTLDEENNSVQVGLKTVSRLGNKFIYEIIQSRPYYSFDEFLENTKISRDRVVLLIKAGAFRNITKRSRMELLKDYVHTLSSPKKVLNGRNINMLITMGLLPSELLAEQHNFNWYKHISSTRNVRKGYFQLDAPGLAYFNKHYNDSELEYFDNGTFIKTTTAKRYVDKTNNTIKEYIKKHHDELLEKVNQNLYDELWDKYKMKNEADGEMQSLRMYSGKHPLSKYTLTYDKLEDIQEDHYTGFFNIKGKRFPKHFIYSIVGTVVASDKSKHMVTLLTPEGAINLKLWRDTYTYFDRKVTSVEDGVQVTIQDSFFEVGTHLVVFGRKSNGMFYPKKYRDTGVESEIMKLNIDNDILQVEAKKDEDSSD